MLHIKSAKIFFFLAVLLFVAKPFLGFGIFSRNHPPAEQSIFVKVFSKRKLEYDEDSKFNMVQKKLAEPVRQFFLRLTFLLGILFPFVFAPGTDITARFLRKIRLSLRPVTRTYLLNGKLII